MTTFVDTIAGLTVETAPTREPIALAHAKAHLRVEHSAEDALIAGLITAARGWVEGYLRRSLYRTGWVLTLDEFPGGPIRLPRPPIIELTSIEYVDTNGVEVTFAPADYQFVSTGWGARILPVPGAEWPSTELGRVGAVRVSYAAGYTSAEEDGDPDSEIPSAIKAAILLVVGHLYANRELSSSGTTVSEIPFSISSLLAPYRSVGF